MERSKAAVELYPFAQRLTNYAVCGSHNVVLLTGAFQGSWKDAFLVRAQTVGLELNGCDSFKVHYVCTNSVLSSEWLDAGREKLPDDVHAAPSRCVI